ncbi:hypothetical protein SAMN05216167_1509 [Spirosoma endophyticum]|uniref:Uncharacterized protein n=1 Tax=Spirosoma endophyticum TaxID=662367 RepID=A0A1I2I035_9BACT|nr:hypothetical protein SAMN05216167_1509 [Spirosoma endophyticum]
MGHVAESYINPYDPIVTLINFRILVKLLGFVNRIAEAICFRKRQYETF